MDVRPSEPSVSRAGSPLCEPRSPPTASVLAKERRDGARGSSRVLAYIPPSEAAGPLKKRLRSAPPEDGGDAQRFKDVGGGVVPDTVVLNDDDQFELASAEPKSLLFSCSPSGAASDMVLGPSGSVRGVQPMSSFELDGAKHKIFLSHSGAQKDFVEQLCVDLERKGYLFPFFDERDHSLPKGEDFAPLIIKAAQMCHVAVIVLSEEFLRSKWPMIELAEFYGAQQGGNKLKLLPLFFKLSIEEVKDEGRWMPKWKEHASCDDRIDLSKWSLAVKALCKSNGLVFGKAATTEVAYRKCVVESIFKLSPPDLPFGSSKTMVGYDRMCKVVSTRFVEATSVGERVLGIYGMAGLGKSTLAKVLHDHFCGEFLGKVCYVDMRRGLRAERQKRMLKMLCGFEDGVACIGADLGRGLMQMKRFKKLDPVFLVLDNITSETHLLQEVRDYLSMGFHPESRILITSSSKAILEDLLPNMDFIIPMPTLMVEEAKELFLKCATPIGAPMKALCELTSEEQNILGICIRKCWFDSREGGFYHPAALKALADFFSRLGGAKRNQFLAWKNHLEKEMDLVKDVLRSSKDLLLIFELQFSTFDLNEQVLFLDLALYLGNQVSWWERRDGCGACYPNDLSWICRLHDENPTIMRRKLLDLRKSGMINFDLIEEVGYQDWCYITVPPLYREFAEWYATAHNLNGLKTAWGVFQPGGMKSWSNLIRLRISPMTHANPQLVASKEMQKLRNLVVLQLSNCDRLTKLNLEGLNCLRDLELCDLRKLKTITLPRNSSKDEYLGIYHTLQHVRLKSLVSLVHMPDLRLCTTLHFVALDSLEGLRNLEGVDCQYVKFLILFNVSQKHFQKILDFRCLQSLEELVIQAENENECFEGVWEQRKGRSYRDGCMKGVEYFEQMEAGRPYVAFFEELHLCLWRRYKMICTDLRRWPSNDDFSP